MAYFCPIEVRIKEEGIVAVTSDNKTFLSLPLEARKLDSDNLTLERKCHYVSMEIPSKISNELLAFAKKDKLATFFGDMNDDKLKDGFLLLGTTLLQISQKKN